MTTPEKRLAGSSRQLLSPPMRRRTSISTAVCLGLQAGEVDSELRRSGELSPYYGDELGRPGSIMPSSQVGRGIGVESGPRGHYRIFLRLLSADTRKSTIVQAVEGTARRTKGRALIVLANAVLGFSTPTDATGIISSRRQWNRKVSPGSTVPWPVEQAIRDSTASRFPRKGSENDRDKNSRVQ